MQKSLDWGYRVPGDDVVTDESEETSDDGPFPIELDVCESTANPPGGASIIRRARAGKRRSVRRLDQTGTMSERDSLRPAMDTELFEDVLDVRCDGLLADDELTRDLALVEALCKEAEDLVFTFRQDGRRNRSSGYQLVRRGVPSDPRKKLVGIHGFGQVVVGADQETGGAIERLSAHAGD